MNPPNPFLQLKENPYFETSNSPIWIASSFSLKRNLASLPFPPKLDQGNASTVLKTLKKGLMQTKELASPQFFLFDEIEDEEKEFLLEHFLTHCDLSERTCKAGAVIDQSGTFLAVINGNDHLTLQSIEAQSEWKEGWKKLEKIEESLAQSHPFAYTPTFGFLTSELAYSGTGFIVQAFLHLPCLIQLDQIDDLLIKDLDDEIEATGLSGTTDYIGDIVIIQNRFTLGLSEDHILEGVHKTATKLAAAEQNLRNSVKETPHALLVDKVRRGVGLLKLSFQVDIKEALSAISVIKLGADLGWITGLTDKELNKIFFEVRRGHLSLGSQETLSQEKLAQKRAEYLQSALKTITINI